MSGDNNSVDLNPFLNEQDDKKLIKILQKLIYTKPENIFSILMKELYKKKVYEYNWRIAMTKIGFVSSNKPDAKKSLKKIKKNTIMFLQKR